MPQRGFGRLQSSPGPFQLVFQGLCFSFLRGLSSGGSIRIGVLCRRKMQRSDLTVHES